MVVKTFIAVVLVLLVGAHDAHACTCFGEQPFCQKVWAHDAVFEGTVESIDVVPGRPGAKFVGQERRVRLRDVRGWIGTPANVVFTGQGHGDCGYDFSVGVRYLIVASRGERDKQLSTGICSPTRPLADASELIAYLETLSKPAPGARIYGQALVDEFSRIGPPRKRTPLSGVRVTVSGPAERAVVTGTDGRYSIDGLPPGKYFVSAQAPANRSELKRFPPLLVTVPNSHACASTIHVTSRNEP